MRSETLALDASLAPAPAPAGLGERMLATLEGEGIADTIATLTLLLFLLYAGGEWYLKVPVTVLCMAGLLRPALRASGDYWLSMTIILVVGNLPNWYLIDNHKYLITYWCGAMACAHYARERERVLRVSARLLIGLAFLFATIWKAISHDYADGTFFHHALLLDQRFAVVGQTIGGIGADMAARNQVAVDGLTAFDSTLAAVQLEGSSRIAAAAQFFTWWTIGIESLVALAFLWPEDRGLSRFRDYVLLTFLVSTYSIAPVIGFGSVLTIMGLMQAARRPRFVRLAYVGAFFLLQLYRIPWKTFISG